MICSSLLVPRFPQDRKWGTDRFVRGGFHMFLYSFQLVTGRTWRGTAFGGVKGRTELPGIVEDYLAGKMFVDEYVTHHTTLTDINKGFGYMHVSLGHHPLTQSLLTHPII